MTIITSTVQFTTIIFTMRQDQDPQAGKSLLFGLLKMSLRQLICCSRPREEFDMVKEAQNWAGKTRDFAEIVDDMRGTTQDHKLFNLLGNFTVLPL